MPEPVPTPGRPPVVYRLRAAVRGPAPGSRLASLAGCTCPPLANRRGAGTPGAAWHVSPRDRTFWLVDRACPLHRHDPGPEAAPAAAPAG